MVEVVFEKLYEVVHVIFDYRLTVFSDFSVHNHVFELPLMEVVLPQSPLDLKSQPFQQTYNLLVVREYITAYLVEIKGVETIIQQ